MQKPNRAVECTFTSSGYPYLLSLLTSERLAINPYSEDFFMLAKRRTPCQTYIPATTHSG